MSKNMETFDARLASFDLVLHPDKRASSSKSVKPITWPHSRPSPAELAHAGFYYNPYEPNPDNTTCFLCERSLDGWGDDDNPIEEHLKHSNNCGWATMMDIQQHSSNPAEIEDPTSEEIVEARKATFIAWPHDGKRGWVCQSRKMVEGGWYFCPTDDSDDQVCCAYCKLSLDGWEPKDKPFDEHHRRSPDCSFFVFAQAPGKKTKGSRSKTTRTSKGSRQSTQSVATTISEAPSMDLDDPMDESILSQSTNKTSKVKKSKTKAKNPRAKRGDSVDVNSQMDIDSTEYADPEPEPPHSKRVTRGRKRSSGVANLDEQDELDKKATDQPQPKKRATKNRDSAAQRDHDESSHALPEDTHAQEEPAPQERKPKRGRPSKKDIAARKASGASNTSKTISKSRVPRDSELDAALKAGLEGDDNMQISDLAKPNKSGPVEAADDDANELENPDPADATDKRKTTRSSTEDNMDTEMPGTRGPPQSNGTENATETEKRGSSMSVETKVTDQEPSEPDHGKAKRGPKKKTTGGRGRKPKKAVKEPETSEHDGQEPSEVKNDMAEQQSEVQKRDSQSSRRRSSMAPPKTTQRYSDIPHEQQFAKSLTESQGSKASGPQVHTSPPAERANDAMSPIPSAPQRLSLSPQSSDAENQPPSAAPSSSRQRVLSPSKKQMSQTPQGAKTPSPTRQDANTGCLKSSHPWVPVDIEDILFAASSDKENANMNGPFSGVKADLTSPEKRMTVEEWISWNAKNGEDRLKRECERLVSEFEREGGRAMRALEGIESID